MPQVYRTQQHWEARAREARHAAEQITDAAAIHAMLKIAESYENLAKRAEARQAGVNVPPHTHDEDHE